MDNILVKQFTVGICSAALILNAFLIPIILFRSTKEMGSYKYLILIYILVELFHSFMTLLTIPVTFFYENYWTLVATNTVLPQFWSTICLTMYGWCIATTYIIILYSFLYRYFVFSKPHMLRWFRRPKRIMVLCFISLFITIIVCVQLYSCQLPKNLTEQYFTGVLGNTIRDPDGSITMLTVWMCSLWTALLSLITVIITIVSVKMFRKFKSYTSSKGMSAKMKNYQKTLLIVLILESVFPTILMFIPMTIALSMFLVGFNSAFLNGIAPFSISISQFMDPLLILCLIKEYRITVLSIFGCHKKRQQQNQTTNIEVKTISGPITSRNGITCPVGD